MRKRCSRSKACGAGCISNAKSCRLNFPTAINGILNRASDQVGVVELYQAVVANGKRGGAAQFEKIRKELRQELGRNIRAGEDARELKRRLVAGGVIPARGNKSKPEEDAGQIFAKAAKGPLKGQALADAMARNYQIELSVRANHGGELRGKAKQELEERLKAEGIPSKEQLREMAKADRLAETKAARPPSVPSALRQELQQLAAKDQQEKIASKPDALYGAWDTDALVKFRKGFGSKAVDGPMKGAADRIDAELARRKAQEPEKPVVLTPRQLDKSPGARTRTPLPPKRTINDEELMDDISRLMKGESPKNISMVGDNSARVKIKSQIGQLQSVLGLGLLTRNQVGRDLEGLINEAKDLRVRLRREQVGFKGTPAEHLALLEKIKKVEAAIKGPTTKATGNVRYAREDARDHDGDMLNKGISRELGNKSYRWEDSYGSGSTLLGKGAYGTVLREPNKGNAIKRGEVGKIEADLIDRLGKADLGPKLLAAQLDGDSQYNPGTKIGRVAMSVVAGSPIGSKAPDKEIGGVKVADAYWVARAKLHRMGIAHNDMHIDNVLIDRKGQARFVDMGLAQDSPKAALAEAMGAFMPPRGGQAERGMGAAGQGDWQVRRWDGTAGRLLEIYEHRLKMGANPKEVQLAREKLEQQAPILAQIQQNKASVQYAMKKDGFSLGDIATVIDHGIRSPMETYEQGVWARMSNEQAQKYISILYEGV